ncbi:MAG TPA: DoxX family protein [Methylophilaceae bacterium]|nr:DoxX family protein [Methylophilaceae bacterium]
MNNYLSLAARVLLAAVFLGLVFIRLTAILASPNGYIEYQVFLGQFGLPGIAAPLIILIQLVAGLALLAGYKTKLAAYVLVGFSLFLALVLGRVYPDAMILYLGIAGGLLHLALNPKTAFALDNCKK